MPRPSIEATIGVTTMRICTVMYYTNGTVSRYHVLRGKMNRGGKSFNSHTARIVASYEITGTPDYRAMTARHATPQVTAVYWQA
jgi:hypothetical protein